MVGETGPSPRVNAVISAQPVGNLIPIIAILCVFGLPVAIAFRLMAHRERMQKITGSKPGQQQALQASEAEEHPAANVVLRAIGIDDHLHMDFEYFELRDGDIFIICSDGLYKDLEETRITSIIENHGTDVKQLATTLLAESLAAGGTDNTSIITMKICQKEDDV